MRRLAKTSGIETPTRAELARFDRSRKNRKTSNKEWKSPQDPDAKIAKMKDGRTHLAHKAEHGVDLETGTILSVTVQDASEGDSATLPETLTMAAEQVESVQPDGEGVEEVVADKGYHSDKTLVALDELGVRSYVSEPERGRRCWQNKRTGETPAEKRAAQLALYGNRRRIRGDRGRRLQRRRGELVERPFAHQYETGGLRRVWVRGHENVRKRVLIQAAGCNLGLLPRRLTGGRHAPEPAGAGSFGDFGPDRGSDRALGASDARLGGQMDTDGARSLNRSSPSCVTGPTQRTDFFHGLLWVNCFFKFIDINAFKFPFYEINRITLLPIIPVFLYCTACVCNEDIWIRVDNYQPSSFLSVNPFDNLFVNPLVSKTIATNDQGTGFAESRAKAIVKLTKNP